MPGLTKSAWPDCISSKPAPAWGSTTASTRERSGHSRPARGCCWCERPGLHPALRSTLPVAGEFAGQLGNSGDTLTLLDAAGAPLINLTWTDAPPWPSAPDGTGYSLTLLSGTTPGSAPNPVSWRASTARRRLPRHQRQPAPDG